MPKCSHGPRRNETSRTRLELLRSNRLKATLTVVGAGQESTSHHRNIDPRPGPSLFSMDGKIRPAIEIVGERYPRSQKNLASSGLSRSRVLSGEETGRASGALVKLTSFGVERAVLRIERVFGLGAE